jgi:hypothetical protein
MSIRKRNVHQKKKYPSQLSVDRKKLQELSCNLMNIEKSQVNRYKIISSINQNEIINNLFGSTSLWSTFPTAP